MENPKIKKILSFGQKQGENTKIQKFSGKLGRLGSYVISKMVYILIYVSDLVSYSSLAHTDSLIFFWSHFQENLLLYVDMLSLIPTTIKCIFHF